MKTQVWAGSSAPTSGARCSSRGEISSEPAVNSSERRACRPPSVALAGNDIGFVQEPEAAVLLKDLARRLEVLRCAQHFAQPLIVDLRHVDRGVPGGEQRRGADAGRDLAR